MSNIQIIIPLDILPEGTALTAESVLAVITESEKHRETAEQYKQMYNMLAQQMASAGKSLALILDEVDDQFEKAQALRGFAQELTQLGRGVREL